MGPLAIAAVGAVSSVGRGAVQSCASIRAGISRTRPVTHFSTLDEDTQQPTPLLGHPILAITDGFAPSARWLTTARHALADLIAGGPALESADARFWSSCGVVFVLPVLDDARFFHAPPARPDAIWASCLEVLISERGLAEDPRHRALVPLGPGGIARAFEIARTWLEQGEIRRVLLVAVDSLLDAWSLDWLARARRLKHASNPVGLVPGESAVALLLERPAPERASPPLAVTRAVVFEESDEPFQNTRRRQGVAASAALERALQSAGPALEGDVYVNLNGEDWRAAELGAALASCPAPASPTARYRLVMPATSLGDVGAAAGAIGIACALHSFARGHASGRRAWILATSDDGDVSALCLEAA